MAAVEAWTVVVAACGWSQLGQIGNTDRLEAGPGYTQGPSLVTPCLLSRQVIERLYNPPEGSSVEPEAFQLCIGCSNP